MTIPAQIYTADETPTIAKNGTRSVEEIDHDATPLVKAVITDATQHVISANPLTTPSDAILLSVDATVTVKMRHNPNPLSLPLLGKIWHPISVTHITGVTAGDVFVGWQRKRKLDVHLRSPSVAKIRIVGGVPYNVFDHGIRRLHAD